MNISNENRSELFAAVSKMQSELTGAFKAKEGHGYSYADLAQCIKTAKEPLSNNGLSVVQLLNETQAGTELETVLMHSSGGYISSSFLMAKAVLMGGGGKNPAQTMGSSITYMRRYAYCAIIGLAQTDDDAANITEPDETAKSWIEAAKKDINVLSQLTDTNYINYIKSYL